MRKPTILDVRDPYLAHFRARGLTEGTIKGHGVMLNRWVELVGNTRIDLLSAAHVETFFGSGEWGTKTQNHRLAQLRTFVQWLHRHRYLPRDNDPTEGFRNVREESKEAFWLPVDEFSALLDAADSARDRAVIAIGLYTFLRGSEIATIRVQDVDFDRHTMEVYRWKTKQADTMPMCLELEEELQRWLREYKRQSMLHLNPDWYLVPTMKSVVDAFTGRYCTELGAELKPLVPLHKPYDVVKRALAKLGYETRQTGAHTLRRSGARALFDRLRSEGYDGALRRVSAMLGHADTKTTEKYLGLSLERQQRNELLAGKAMFPDKRHKGQVRHLKGVSGGNRG